MDEYDKLRDAQRELERSLYAEISQLRQEINARETRQLRWGIGALGSVVLVLGGWAWSQIADLIALNIGAPK